jgi:hypothetical protein
MDTAIGRLAGFALVIACCTHAGATRALAQCIGDCNGDSRVTIDEVVAVVNIALHGI